MISEKSSTNPENFTLIGDTSCNGGRNPMEIPTYIYFNIETLENITFVISA
jgi:hypothetical protein